MLGTALSIVIPLTVAAYAIWLAVRALSRRGKGRCAGGCANCPYAGSCTVPPRRRPGDKEEPHG